MVYATEAASVASSNEVAGVALAGSDSVPVGIVNYVRRTGESVVLAQAETDEQHRADPYVVQNRPRSVVCLPIHAHGRAIGALYLEHRHVSGIFAPERLVTLRILATQAAVSLENNQLFAGLKQEITEHERAQEHLRNALAEVERLKVDLEAENSYLRRDLIANVSHDLRTPLVSMRGYLEVLQTKGETLTAQTRQQYLGVAIRQSEHLASLIDGLFELARLDFKGMTLNCESFSMAELASDVLQKFQLSADDKQVVLGLEGLPRLPFVEGDLSLLERVLENLIGNAMKHTPAGGQVCVRQRVDGAHVVTEVSDTGSGIASAELPFVFDRFYRGTNGRTPKPVDLGWGSPSRSAYWICTMPRSASRVTGGPERASLSACRSTAWRAHIEHARTGQQRQALGEGCGRDSPRTPSVRSASSTPIDKLVAHAPHGVDVTGLAGRLYLVAQAIDVGVDGVFVAIVAVTPDLVKQLRACEDAARMACKVARRSNSLAVSSTGCRHGRTMRFAGRCNSPTSMARSAIDSVPCQRLGAAEHPFHTGHQLKHAERLGQVVVGAEFKTQHAVEFSGLGRQHQDGRIPRARAAAADLQTIHPRQHEVENDQLVTAGLGLGQCGHTITDQLALTAKFGELQHDQTPNVRIVLDHQHTTVIQDPFLRGNSQGIAPPELRFPF